jgi:hypothetical protein
MGHPIIGPTDYLPVMAEIATHKDLVGKLDIQTLL